MSSIKCEFLILGSGFGGSLLALILARAGRSVAMVDRTQHPRFAIGESSTPLADRTLAQMAEQYGLPELSPLCHWGSWKRDCSQLLCGKKRGFTYFDQTAEEDLHPKNFAPRRLLVSASVDDEHSDTHWLRSDVDQFLFELARSSGVTAFQECQYVLNQKNDEWIIDGNAARDHDSFQSKCTEDRIPVLITAPFLVDATGSSNAVLKFLNVPDQRHLLKTNSRAIFAHFASAKTCAELLSDHSIAVEAFPYQCDDAAVHHVLPDGWMWQLRFDDDSLSAGFMIDQRGEKHQSAQSAFAPLDEWNQRISASPFLSRQFQNAKILRPNSGIQGTQRIQRLTAQSAGANWAAIANTAGFIDPLHSTGIAHTLFSVSRLADILLQEADFNTRHQKLCSYSESLIGELQLVDELVEGCYEAIPQFRLWCLWGMLYFAAATSMEQTPGSTAGQASFLRAKDHRFRDVIREARCRLAIARQATAAIRSDAETDFESWLKEAIRPWNHVGLFDDACNNLYSNTAAPSADGNPGSRRNE